MNIGNVSNSVYGSQKRTRATQRNTAVDMSFTSLLQKRSIESTGNSNAHNKCEHHSKDGSLCVEDLTDDQINYLKKKYGESVEKDGLRHFVKTNDMLEEFKKMGLISEHELDMALHGFNPLKKVNPEWVTKEKREQFYDPQSKSVMFGIRSLTTDEQDLRKVIRKHADDLEAWIKERGLEDDKNLVEDSKFHNRLAHMIETIFGQ